MRFYTVCFGLAGVMLALVLTVEIGGQLITKVSKEIEPLSKSIDKLADVLSVLKVLKGVQ